MRIAGLHIYPVKSTRGQDVEAAQVERWGLAGDRRFLVVDADAWFSALLGREVGLVWLDDPTSRPVNPAYGVPGDTVSFADGYPLLLTATASLSQLNDWITATAAERGEFDVEPCGDG